MAGKWVWVQEAEEKPKSFTSLRRSQIFLTLYFKVSAKDVDFCIENNLLPPEELTRGKQLSAWIQGARSMKARQVQILCGLISPIMSLFCGAG